MNERQQALDALGLANAPAPRLPGLWEQPAAPPGKQILNFKKALQLVDPIETATFAKYIPDDVIIDQAMDARSFSTEGSKCVMLRTDVPIPSVRAVFRSTGIGSEPNAHNHYLWLGQELGRHFLELGARAMAPPLVFRTNGANGTVPFLGLVMRLDLRPKDGQTVLDQGANWALMGEKRAPRVVLEDGESVDDVK